MQDLRNHRAVVTGASSGIGEHIARILASWGCDLVLAARREDRLRALGAELGAAHGVTVDVVAVDLTEDGGCARLFEAAHAGGKDIDILINNAGYSAYAEFAPTPWEHHETSLRLNVLALAELTHRFVGRMLARDRRAYVLNVASVAAYMPMPYFANYAAGKAYVRAFSESLASELAGSNVTVTCVSPGPTRTEFSEIAGQVLSTAQQRWLMSPERVARKGLDAMLAGRRAHVPGALAKLSCAAAGLLPRRLMAWASARTVGRPAAQPRLEEKAS